MTFASTRYKLPPGETPSVPLVRFEHLGNIARIILARPDAGNAINATLIADLGAAVDAVRAVEPRSVLITAEGANFSLGGDLKHLLAAGSDVAAELGRMAHDFHAAQLRLIGIGVPIIAAARGHTIGGGFGLALSSDYLLCSENARFSTGYSRLGLSADAGVSYFLTRALGVRRARTLLMDARFVSADEAVLLGIADRKVSDDRLDTAALDLARELAEISHRAWFSPEEYKLLYKATRDRVENPVRKKYINDYAELHDYVLFMVNTGLRPDESRRIEFRDVKVVNDRDSNETILEIDVRGKRGVGFCKSMPGAVVPFQRLQKRRKPAPTDLVFPTSHHELFNTILGEIKLKFDREGQRRTFYSLRHTYICLRLMEGADVYQIAKNCRTSVKMIEDFYASHIKNMVDASVINVRRAKPALKQAKGARRKELAD